MSNETKATAKASAGAISKYEVTGTFYLGTKECKPGEVVDLTASQAKRLGNLVKPTAAA